MGEVIAVGNGKILKRERRPLEVKKGDKVLFGKQPARPSRWTAKSCW